MSSTGNYFNYQKSTTKQLDQDEIIETLNQAKAPEQHAAMVAANIDFFSMSYEESVSDFKQLENLEKSQSSQWNGTKETIEYKDSKFQEKEN